VNGTGTIWDENGPIVIISVFPCTFLVVFIVKFCQIFLGSKFTIYPVYKSPVGHPGSA